MVFNHPVTAVNKNEDGGSPAQLFGHNFKPAFHLQATSLGCDRRGSLHALSAPRCIRWRSVCERVRGDAIGRVIPNAAEVVFGHGCSYNATMQFLENKINLLFEVSGTVLGDAGCGVRVCVLVPVCGCARASVGVRVSPCTRKSHARGMVPGGVVGDIHSEQDSTSGQGVLLRKWRLQQAAPHHQTADRSGARAGGQSLLQAGTAAYVRCPAFVGYERQRAWEWELFVCMASSAVRTGSRLTCYDATI